MALEQGLGHEDLDKIMRQPQSLDFTFGMSAESISEQPFYYIWFIDLELIKVLRPGEFEKDTYLLSDEEKKRQIPELKLAGNNLYNAGQFAEAVSKYGQALQFFEDLMLK